LTKQQVQKKAEQLLKYYQPIFRLSDWDITVTVLDDTEYQNDHGDEFAKNTSACNYIVTETKNSRINLRFEPQPQSLAENLVHELVHLMVQEQWKFAHDSFELIDSDSARGVVNGRYDQLLETTVSNVTRALICCLLLGGKYKE